MFKPTRLMIAATASVMALAGCQTMPTQTAGNCKPLPGTEAPTSTLQNILIGTAVGVALGTASAKNSKVGARNGALFGAIAGAVAGSAFAKSVGVTEQTDGSVKLDVPGSVLFPSGSHQLDPQFKQTLDTVAGTIKEYCGVTAQVVGHTDNVGRVEANKVLSENRAKAVTTYLASLGVDAGRLTSAGMADGQPVAPNTDAAGRQQNRRVEIFVRPPAQ